MVTLIWDVARDGLGCTNWTAVPRKLRLWFPVWTAEWFCSMLKLSTEAMVKTEGDMWAHTSVVRWCTACDVANLSWVSGEATQPRRLRILINSLEPPCVSTISAKMLWTGVGLLGFVMYFKRQIKRKWRMFFRWVASSLCDYELYRCYLIVCVAMFKKPVSCGSMSSMNCDIDKSEGSWLFGDSDKRVISLCINCQNG